MTKKIMALALLCLALTQTNAQYAVVANYHSQQTMFNGNYLGSASGIYYGLSLQNNGGIVSGFLSTSQDESYSLTAKIDQRNVVKASIGNNQGSYNCTLYYSGNSLILELDQDLVASIQLLLILAGEWEAALSIDSRIVMQPV